MRQTVPYILMMAILTWAAPCAFANDKAAEQLLATGQVEGWVSERAVLESAAAHDPGLRDAHLLLPRVQQGEPLAIAMPKDAQFSMAVEAAPRRLSEPSNSRCRVGSAMTWKMSCAGAQIRRDTATGW